MALSWRIAVPFALACVCACAAGCLFIENGPPDGSEFSGKGTVILVTEQGGFFGIIGDDGNQYYPINLDDEFKVHGQRVRFSARVRGDMVSIQRWGTPIEVLYMEQIPNS